MSRIKDCKVTVGCPPPSSFPSGEEWKSFQFHIHNFAALSTTMDDYIQTPDFTCNGRQWQLRVYPGGKEEASEGMVSVYLRHLSEGTIKVNYRISVMDKFGKSKKEVTSKCREFSSCNSWGWYDFISRSDIVDESQDILDSNGTLTIVASVREEPTTIFVPENPLLGKGKGKEKGWPKASVSFHAHRSILTKCAPVLADLLGSNDTVSITDVDPDVFELVLYYVYGGEVSEEEFEDHGKDIIDAADKYAIVNLKLAAEAKYVELTEITFDNAIDNLLYADRKNCALLKEKVMRFLADNHYEAAEKISFSDFPGDLVKDLLIAVGRNSKKDSGETNVDELTTLCVDKLRRKLAKLGLEVDGSREAMIESIKAHSSED